MTGGAAGRVPTRAARRPWLVQVAGLRRQPGGRRSAAISAPVDELFVSSARVSDGAEVGFEGELEAVAGGVIVHGRVRAPWEGTCRRCLAAARGELDVEVRELASEDPDPELGYALTPDWLDLEPIVHDACILELPLAPLCVDDCRGLCPDCGANRNVEACSREAPSDPRWAALADLSEGAAVEQGDRTSARSGRQPAPDEDEPGRRTG